MNQVSKLAKLVDLSYFNLNTLDQVLNLGRQALYANVKRWLRKGYLIQLKKGWYVTKTFLDRTDKLNYTEFLANWLRQPSYLSTEYILQKYSVLTESVFSYTSITLKAKRNYQNQLGNFLYRQITKDLFAGFSLVKDKRFQIYEATKSKALFDYLYLNLFRRRKISKSLIDALRLNLDSFTLKEIREFKSYCRTTKINKFIELPEKLFS